MREMVRDRYWWREFIEALCIPWRVGYYRSRVTDSTGVNKKMDTVRTVIERLMGVREVRWTN